MSDELDDEYDDFEDSFLEDDEDEGEGEESECDEDLEEEYEDDDSDLDGEYDEESSCCFVCNNNSQNVPEDDRWRFAVVDEGGGDRTEFWACRSCRAKFASLEEFDEFRTNWARSRLYRCAATLQRLILLKAPDCIVAQAAFVVASCVFSEGSGNLAVHGAEELKKLALRLENQTGSDR